MPTTLARRFRVVQALVDCLAWSIALIVATVLRFEFNLDLVDWWGVVLVIPIAIEIQLFAGYLAGLYRGRWRFGSFDEVAHLVAVVGGASLFLAVLDQWTLDHAVPVSATLAGGFIALVLMAGARYSWRLYIERRSRPHIDDCERLVVFGAGDAGAQIVTSMLTDPEGRYYPVALLDDDPRRGSLSIKGIRVEGARNDLARVARAHGADGVLIAIPSADAQLVREISALADEINIDTRVLPSNDELLDGRVRTDDIRKVTDRDLLGRRQIELDIDSIAHYLTGKRVLVTGAGGSIGSELCRQIQRFAPNELIMLDRDESALHAVELSLEGAGLLQSPNLVVADVRDHERISEVFEARKPHVVFHTAALKHLPLLELHPSEGVKTNVFGTLNVLAAAQHTGVEAFVNISTDKAAEPISVLGYTKLIAERLTGGFAYQAEGTYISVRFGNVLGSRGSVVETFREQIAMGGPVTVTDPDVERFFMTVEEAVQLVIQAGAAGRDGETLVLDMGEPVKIAQLAERMIAMTGQNIEITYTGIRPGEKLREVLFQSAEVPSNSHHELLYHVRGAPLDPDQVGALLGLNDRASVVGRLRHLCGVDGPPFSLKGRPEVPTDSVS